MVAQTSSSRTISVILLRLQPIQPSNIEAVGFSRGDTSMSKEQYPIELPPSIAQAALKLAEEDGVCLNQWVSGAVAQKISSVESAEAFFKRRSQGADKIDFLEILRSAPDREPDLGDELR
jgi:hypothetical protein